MRATLQRFLHSFASVLFAATVAFAPCEGALAQPYDRAQVEAAYLLNFIRYTEWPAAAMPPPEAPIVVVVYRASRTADALEAIAASGERIAGREIEVRATGSEERLARELRGAHVLYVGADADASAALAHAGDMVLTVGSAEGFSEVGGMLCLVPQGNRVVFDANVGAIRASGLSVSAKVLALARRVEGKG
ncbi:MAG TPA: YfiR family protein [Xanthomonadales bacterium]|nr:YfiR family protein [Xanthomonadales bacterium]